MYRYNFFLLRLVFFGSSIKSSFCLLSCIIKKEGKDDDDDDVNELLIRYS